MTSIRITLGSVVVTATLNDSRTADLIVDALPLKSKAQLWGDEIYFSIPVEAREDNAQADVPSGTVAYWPAGKALCLFFGQKPYSPVNVVGEIDGDPGVLAGVGADDKVRVEKA
jgi:hypothetical protein